MLGVPSISISGKPPRAPGTDGCAENGQQELTHVDVRKRADVTSRWPFSYGHRGDVMGVGRHVFLEKVDAKAPNPNRSNGCDRWLGRSLQECLLVSLSHAPCGGLYQRRTALQYLISLMQRRRWERQLVLHQFCAWMKIY